ncbi:MAG: hypothetical protein ABSH35_32820 [Isosphaeraceae bacterium]
MFQTSTNRQPLFDGATTPPTSHPTLHALATFAVTYDRAYLRVAGDHRFHRTFYPSRRWGSRPPR